MKYYCVMQHDMTDCGAACLATIAEQNGSKISISRIREAAGTDRQGTNVYGLIKAAEEIGFEAQGVKGDKEAFFTEFPLPCIAHVMVAGRTQHYVVIHKITKNKIILADPAKGICTVTPLEFFGEDGSESNPPYYRWTGVLVLLTKKQTFQKQKGTGGIIGRFFYLLKPQRKLLLHIFMASMLYTVLGILGAFYFQLLIDDILPGNMAHALTVLSVGIIVLNIFKVLLDAFRQQLLLYLSQKLDIPLMLGYYNHVTDLPMNFFGTRKIGEIISRFQDAANVREAISGATLTIMLDTVMAAAGGILLYFKNPRMFGIALIIVVIYLITVAAFRKSYDDINRQQMEDNSGLTSYLVESLRGIQTVKAYHAERKIKMETETKFVSLLKSVFRLGCVGNLQESIKNFTEYVGEILIIWAGAAGVLNGQMSIGELVTFNALLVYFLDPVKNLIDLQPQVQTAVVAADRLGEILDLKVEMTEKERQKLKPERLRGDIRFHDVTFRYGTRQAVLEEVNMEIHEGETIALIGESGSGKSTLARLLLNFYQPERGEITIDGNNIQDIQIETLRDRIAYVSQETFLFAGTIMENLSLGMDEPDPDRIIEAAKKAEAHEFINRLPDRYQTVLEENGQNLSGGQRQRLSIARALLKNPDILILDEATGNLDVETERRIDGMLKEYSKNRTTIVITHRQGMLEYCNRIFRVEQGRITEQKYRTET